MPKLEQLELTKSWDHESEIMGNYIKVKSVGGDVLQILEAGCGKSWSLNLDGVEYVLTGVDTDKVALEMRKNIINDLDKAVEGDLRYVVLKNHQYDVIYSSFVLEHIKGAEQVLNNFVYWIKPAGIIIIRIPDPNSVQGFLTRITPHWLHILYYRFLLGRQNAGKAGYAPYPVHYDPVVSRKGMREFCRRNNVDILAEYGDGHIRPGKGFVVRLFIHFLKYVVHLFSFCLLSARHTNLLYILQKR
ncbi:class I SAM-dependent methyltransferase [bacterium]|nr:class I SAM-dependent methyltransferase [bacterium]